MATPTYEVDFVFLEDASGSSEYVFTYVYEVDDPKEGMKANVIHGTRGDGCIVIPGGKKSQEIIVKGRIRADGFSNITTAMDSMRSAVTTDAASLTMKYRLNGAGGWSTAWSYSIRRIGEIEFAPSLRTDEVEYIVTFLVTGY